MTQIALIIFWTLLGLVVGQAFLVAGFVWKLLSATRSNSLEEYCPKVAVVLCLRGGDPFLPECIKALLNLDYPNYDVKIIVDDRHDPAWKVAEDVINLQAATHVEMQALTERRDTCSLKCSSIVQVLSDLDDSYEVIAQLDADTIAHPTWLRELVSPLADERVGATNGNRWYMPQNPTWGSVVRYVWNAAAVVQMYWYRIAWGGTLAVKAEVFKQSDLLERWGNAFCEDTMLFKALREQQRSVVFVPSLMMVNREGCDIGGYFRWVSRQLLNTRLYHPCWFAIVLHGVSTTLCVVVTIGILLAAVITNSWEAAIWAGGSLVCYQLAIALMLLPMEFAVRRIVAARDEPTKWWSLAVLTKFFPAVAITQVIYAGALTVAYFMRVVDWRGVSYRIGGPWKIRLLEYRPYAPDESVDAADQSL